MSEQITDKSKIKEQFSDVLLVLDKKKRKWR